MLVDSSRLQLGEHGAGPAQPARAPDAACLEARGLTVRFAARTVLDAIDFSVRAGEIAVIEGPSGGGKSTFLRALATLQEATQGGVLLDGVAATEMPSSAYRRRVAYVPQLPVMFAGMVSDNVRAGPRLGGRELADDQVAGLLARVVLAPAMATRRAHDLSGGEKQRVAIARALANQPEVILFDEPTSALDPSAADSILALVRRCAQDGCAVVIVTHVREQATTLAGTRYTCEAGHLHRRGAA